MFHLKVKNFLVLKERKLVDQLIFDVWSYERSATFDVEMIAGRDIPIRDPLDRNARHVLVYYEEQLIGYGRITIFGSRDDLKTAPCEVPSVNGDYRTPAFISRLVVHPSFRGRGVATMIDEERIAIASESGVDLVVGCAVGASRQKALGQAGFSSSFKIESFATPWYKTSRPVMMMQLNLSQARMQRSIS